MNFLSFIEAKREGKSLSSDQINHALKAFVAGEIPDYQMAAFLMAVYFRGLNEEETRALTLGMRDSGETLQFPDDPRPLVDKHSTGGVGDKVSLPLSPLLACLGFRVPMISGRGLGITGGTLDKLESIPGFTINLSTARIVEIVQKVGCVICGQTDTMVPADKKLYALRDVTGTVPSIPLITASILSKKLAENLSALVLDVKFGSAAFMPTIDEARKLADSMVRLGTECGVRTCAILSDMNTPLGRAAGNWLEVREAVECLETNVLPASCRQKSRTFRQDAGSTLDNLENCTLNDLRTLVVECAAQLLVLSGRANDLNAGRSRANECLASGTPRRKWDEMLIAQGADVDAFNERLKQDSTAPVITELKADRDGYIAKCDALIIGEIVRDLGGGRLTKDSEIQPDVGVDALMKPGEPIKKGAALARVHATEEGQARSALARLRQAFDITAGPVPPRQLVHE